MANDDNKTPAPAEATPPPTAIPEDMTEAKPLPKDTTPPEVKAEGIPKDNKGSGEASEQAEHKDEEQKTGGWLGNNVGLAMGLLGGALAFATMGGLVGALLLIGLALLGGMMDGDKGLVGGFTQDIMNRRSGHASPGDTGIGDHEHALEGALGGDKKRPLMAPPDHAILPETPPHALDGAEQQGGVSGFPSQRNKSPLQEGEVVFASNELPAKATGKSNKDLSELMAAYSEPADLGTSPINMNTINAGLKEVGDRIPEGVKGYAKEALHHPAAGSVVGLTFGAPAHALTQLAQSFTPGEQGSPIATPTDVNLAQTKGLQKS